MIMNEQEPKLLDRNTSVKERKRKIDEAHGRAFQRGKEILRSYGVSEGGEIATYAGMGIMGMRRESTLFSLCFPG